MFKKVALILVFLLALFPISSFASSSVFAFESNEYHVFVGKSISVKPVAQNIKGTASYTWSSSDNTIATVKSGKVTGISAGNAEITCNAKYKNGDNFSASYTIVVTQAVEKILCEDKSITLGSVIGDISRPPIALYTPRVTVLPENATNKNIIWTTEPLGVAMVFEDNLIVGTIPGTTTLIGTAADGSGVKVKIKLTVPDVLVSEESITITEPEPYLFGYQICAESDPRFPISSKGLFSIEEDSEADGMTWIKIIPEKAGTDYLVFETFYRKKLKVQVNIKHSAVYDSVSYPKGNISKILANKEKSIGQNVSFKGEIISIVPSYIFLKVADQKYIAIPNMPDLSVGETITIYGTLDSFITYSTSTGLSYDCPLFLKGIYRK